MTRREDARRMQRSLKDQARGQPRTQEYMECVPVRALPRPSGFSSLFQLRRFYVLTDDQKRKITFRSKQE